MLVYLHSIRCDEISVLLQLVQHPMLTVEQFQLYLFLFKLLLLGGEMVCVVIYFEMIQY